MILKKLARGILVMLSLFLLENAHLAESESVTVKVTESKVEAGLKIDKLNQVLQDNNLALSV